MTQDQEKASLTVDDILSIGRRAMDKCHGTEAQHIYIAREVERRLQAAPAAVPDGHKLVIVPNELPGGEPDWDEVRRQAEVTTGLKVGPAFSILIREVRRWLVHRASHAPAALQPAQADQAPAPAPEPVAVRYDFDGYGWKYIDNGSGSDWMTRHPDGELLYDGPAPAVGADDARDAARYRWLKSLPGASPRMRGMAIDGAATLKHGFRAPHAVYVADGIDGAIDAAIGEVKPPVQGSEQ